MAPTTTAAMTALIGDADALGLASAPIDELRNLRSTADAAQQAVDGALELRDIAVLDREISNVDAALPSAVADQILRQPRALRNLRMAMARQDWQAVGTAVQQRASAPIDVEFDAASHAFDVNAPTQRHRHTLDTPMQRHARTHTLTHARTHAQARARVPAHTCAPTRAQEHMPLMQGVMRVGACSE